MVAEQRLKIVQILPELEEGGVEGETCDLAVYLARQGHESLVISGGGRMVPILEREGCRHIHWPAIGEKSVRCLKYITRLRRFLLEEHVDVLHLRSRLPAWIGFLAWKSLPARKRPALVTTFHGFYSINGYSAIMTKGELVAAVSDTIKQHILENYKVDESRIRLIHGGFDVAAFSPESVSLERVDELKKTWLPPHQQDVPVILLPGRLTQWKGQDVLVDSLAQLKDQNFVALLVGDIHGNQSFTRKLQEKISAYGLEDRIHLVGHCNDMPAAMRLADIVVSASSTQPEAFGKVAIEAMAMGKPVVATAHGGSMETVIPGITGWLVPPLDACSMADALAEALSDPENARKLGEQGRQWVSERFTADNMCRRSMEFYKEAWASRQTQNKQLTVMQLLPELGSGGVERGTLEMGRFLAANGHRSLVVSAGGRLTRQLEEDGSVHFTKTVGSKSPIALAHVWSMRRLLVRQHVDVLHLRSRMPAWVAYLACMTLPRACRPLIVTTFHGFYSVNSYSAIMTKGDGVIAVSEGIRQHIEQYYARTRDVELIFRGVDISVFDPDGIAKQRIDALRRAWNVPNDRPVIMLPGRLTRLKGQDLFLESLTKLDKGIEFCALIVGDYEDNPGFSAELRQFVKENGLTDRVSLVGHCSDMPAALLLADIVVSATSLEPEAFGRTIVEAMAMGKPVIATGHGGSMETVLPGRNGWLVEPGNVVALAATVDEALRMQPEQLREYGANGRKRVLENYTAEVMCRQTFSFYCKLLRRKRAQVAVACPAEE